ncbi:MAG: extracellular solute-binding protein [Caldilinea sp. CFX5]|nr:extracellular solute-binding protein [Caldilinea sp. CFX5]
MEQRQTLSRRNFLKVTAAGAGVTALSGLLSACLPTGGPASSSAGAPGAAGTEVSWYEWGDVLDKDIADRCIADFQEAHPDITIRLEQSPTGYYDKLQTALAGGTAADIINNQTWLFQSFSAKGVYAQLDELRSRDDYNTPYPDAWADVYQAQTQFRGNPYGVPWNMNAMVIFYAKAPFDKLGIPYPTDDWTYDEFVELTQKLTGTVEGVEQFGYQTNPSYERLACWMRLNGDKEWDQEIEPKQALWDQEYIMQMINFQLYQAINEFKVSPTPAMMEGGLNQLESGNVAMKMEGPWFFPKMACGEWSCTDEQKKSGGVPFGVAQLPLSPDGKRAHMVFGHVLLMNAKTQNADGAEVRGRLRSPTRDTRI